MCTLKQWAAVAALALSGACVQAVPMFGSTFDYQVYWPDIDTPVATPGAGHLVVGDGVEVPDVTGIGGASLDITATQIIFDFSLPDSTLNFLPGAFNGIVLTDVFGTIDDFVGVSIDASSDWAAFEPSRVTFTGDSIAMNFESLSMADGQRLVLNVETAAVELPEPGTLALAALALVGIAAILRGRWTASITSLRGRWQGRR